MPFRDIEDTVLGLYFQDIRHHESLTWSVSRMTAFTFPHFSCTRFQSLGGTRVLYGVLVPEKIPTAGN